MQPPEKWPGSGPQSEKRRTGALRTQQASAQLRHWRCRLLFCASVRMACSCHCEVPSTLKINPAGAAVAPACALVRAV